MAEIGETYKLYSCGSQHHQTHKSLSEATLQPLGAIHWGKKDGGHLKACKDCGNNRGDEGGSDETIDLEVGAGNADQAGHDEAGHEGEGEGDVGEGEDGAVPGGEDKASPAEEVEEAKEANLISRILSHLQNPLPLF